MNTSISYSKIIKDRLEADNRISNNLTRGDEIRFYPVVAEAEAVYPYIVYNKQVYSVEYTKSGVLADNVQITFNVVSKFYTDVIKITEVIRDIFENSHDDQINDMTVSSITESYSGDAYVMTIQFDAQVFPLS